MSDNEPIQFKDFHSQFVEEKIRHFQVIDFFSDEKGWTVRMLAWKEGGGIFGRDVILTSSDGDSISNVKVGYFLSKITTYMAPMPSILSEPTACQYPAEVFIPKDRASKVYHFDDLEDYERLRWVKVPDRARYFYQSRTNPVKVSPIYVLYHMTYPYGRGPDQRPVMNPLAFSKEPFTIDLLGRILGDFVHVCFDEKDLSDLIDFGSIRYGDFSFTIIEYDNFIQQDSKTDK